MKIPVFTSLLAAIVLSGCAVGNKHVYNDITPIVGTRTDKSVAVAAVDQRSYVLSGQSTPDLVGMQRGGFGNPFDVLTASGRPLSGEFATAMKDALAKNGVKVMAIDTKPATSTQPAMTDLIASAGDRLLLLGIQEWIGDSQINTEVRYELQLVVADSGGKTLASKRYSGTRALGGSHINPPGHAKEVMPKAFQETVETLLNSPEIATALK